MSKKVSVIYNYDNNKYFTGFGDDGNPQWTREPNLAMVYANVLEAADTVEKLKTVFGADVEVQ